MCGTYDGFCNGDSVDHLAGGYRIRRTTLRGAGEGFERSARDVEPLGFPSFRRSFDGLEFAGTEQARTALFGRRSGHMGHAFEPHPAFGTEHLKAEARSGRGHRAEIARHTLFHAEKDGCRIVGIDRHDAMETLREYMIDGAAEIDHTVYRVHSHWRETAARSLVAACSPGFGLEHE